MTTTIPVPLDETAVSGATDVHADVPASTTKLPSRCGVPRSASRRC